MTGSVGDTGVLGELFRGPGSVGVVVAAIAWVAWAARAMADRRRERRTRKRVSALLEHGSVPGRLRRAEFLAWSRTWAAPLAAAVAGWTLFGGVVGFLVGVGAAYAVRRGLTRRVAMAGDDGEAARQLPLAADLLAACASAGAGPGEAAEAVGRSLGGPVGERLIRTAAELRLGGEPADVWRRFGAIPGAEGLARCLERAGSSGAPAAEAIARHAAGLRAERARRAAARAQRAQVLITAPVGLCFLPAFLAVGVAPVVIGLATGLLGR